MPMYLVQNQLFIDIMRRTCDFINNKRREIIYDQRHIVRNSIEMAVIANIWYFNDILMWNKNTSRNLFGPHVIVYKWKMKATKITTKKSAGGSKCRMN